MALSVESNEHNRSCDPRKSLCIWAHNRQVYVQKPTSTYSYDYIEQKNPLGWDIFHSTIMVKLVQSSSRYTIHLQSLSYVFCLFHNLLPCTNFSFETLTKIAITHAYYIGLSSTLEGITNILQHINLPIYVRFGRRSAKLK